MFSIFLILLSLHVTLEVPFVTKRVSLHNPIAIDFSGWRPLRDKTTETEDLETSSSEISKDKQFLTVPVAVETDAEHVLSESDLNQIRDHVIDNWRQQPIRSESFPHMRPLVPQLLPKPEVEVTKEETQQTSNDRNDSSDPEEYTFVKMDKNGGNSSSENLFHAYFAGGDHIPPEGYIRLTKTEFKNVFKNAEILFV